MLAMQEDWIEPVLPSVSALTSWLSRMGNKRGLGARSDGQGVVRLQPGQMDADSFILRKFDPQKAEAWKTQG